MLKRFLLALAVWPVPTLLGQFHNLVTNGDGSVLVFSSTLRMKGTDQPPWEKLFRIDGSGLSLYFERDKVVPAEFSFLTNHYRAIDADMSGEGSVTAVVTAADCAVGGSSCFLGQPKNQAEIAPATGRPAMTLQGEIRLSRNGRYALLCCDGSMTSGTTLRDLDSGQTIFVLGPTSGFDISARPMVASSGVAVVPWRDQTLILASLAGVRKVPVAAVPAQAAMDDSATTAVYAGGGGTVLARVDVATGVETPIWKGAGLRLVGIADRGDLIAFLAGTEGVEQLWVVRPDGSDPRRITTDTAGITEAALSGSGAVAWAATAAGRILKIEVASGGTTELIGGTVTLQIPSPSVLPAPVAGSAWCVNGTGLADRALDAVPPLPTSLGGLELRLDGQPVPLLSVAPGQACFQVPWGTSRGAHNLEAIAQSNPFLEGSASAAGGLEVDFEAAASFVRLGSQYPSGPAALPYPLAAHGDFSGLVTPVDPAHPGEILHFYMTGLGPVEPLVETGAPSPSDPPARAVLSFECHLAALPGSGAIPLDVLFAGLAPTFTGYYQVSVRLPADVPSDNGSALMFCSAGAPSAGESAWVPVARPQ
jgi:uncharacterized protein (TIGR03437 family)